jgi:putative tricarboxylic transport membrane protein
MEDSVNKWDAADKKERNAKTDITVSLVLIAFCTAALIYSLRFPVSDRSVGVGTFPRILSALIIVLSLLQIIIAVVKKQGGVVHPFKIPRKTLILIGISTALIILYILIIQYIGFLLSTVLFLASLIFSFGERVFWKIAVISISVTGIIYIMFSVLARVPFPEGFWENVF